MASMSTLATTDYGDVVVGLGVVASDGLSWCRLLLESAWSSVLSRSRVARCPLVRMAVMAVWWLDWVPLLFPRLVRQWIHVL